METEKILCFGTFAKVLWCCKKVKTSKKALVQEIILALDPKSGYLNDYPAFTRLLQCNKNFVVSDNRNNDKATIIQAFENKVLPLLHSDKICLAIYALCEIVHDDQMIDEKYQETFKQHFCVYKSSISSQDIASVFFASALIYSAEINNTLDLGKKCVTEITPEYVDQFKNQKSRVRIWNTQKQKEDYAKEIEHEKLNETPINFSNKFNQQVVKLEGTLLELKGELDNGSVMQNSSVSKRFVEEFTKTSIEGQNLVNAIGDLRNFIADINSNKQKWDIIVNQLDADSTEIGTHQILILNDIRNIIRKYNIFKYDYFLSKEILFPQDTTKKDRMRMIFNHAISDCRIVDFMNKTPVFSVNVVWFIKIIEINILSPFIIDQTEETYHHIQDFAHKLEDYHTAIGLELVYSSDDEYTNRMNELYCSLLDLYSKINDGKTLKVYNPNNLYSAIPDNPSQGNFDS